MGIFPQLCKKRTKKREDITEVKAAMKCVFLQLLEVDGIIIVCCCFFWFNLWYNYSLFVCFGLYQSSTYLLTAWCLQEPETFAETMLEKLSRPTFFSIHGRKLLHFLTGCTESLFIVQHMKTPHWGAFFQYSAMQIHSTYKGFYCQFSIYKSAYRKIKIPSLSSDFVD